MGLYKEVRKLLEAQNVEFVSYLDVSEAHIIQPHLMPENIKGVFVWLLPYYTGAHPDRNVSLYSVSLDYHLLSRSMAQSMKEVLSAKYETDGFYFFCDSSPVNEVALAVRSGLGVIGRNRLLINEKYGSHVFIGSMLTTLSAEDAPELSPKEKSTCLECGACMRACEFLRGESSVCTSELNQRKLLTEEELAFVRSKKIRWGCDVCQESCPMNRSVPETPIEFFYENQIETVTPELLEAMSKADFKTRAYSWRGKKTIIRNLV